MSSWKQIFFGILLGLLLSAGILLVSQAPRGTVITLQTRTPKNIFVHIAGAVNNPGVVMLPWASRVANAVQAAGGFSEYAQQDAVNLAAPISDGEKIFIPAINNTPIPQLITPSSKNAPSVTLTQPSGALININTAQSQELERLPGIGPTKAQSIILYRQEHGPFKKLEDLMQVSGIGKATFDQLKELITLGN